MYFLKKPTIVYNIPENIKITYIKKKYFYISTQITNNIKILYYFKNNDFQIYTNSKILIIQPLFHTKKKNIQLCGLYSIKLRQFSQQVLKKVFKKILFLKGIGFKAKVDGVFLQLKLGFSHEVILTIPKYIKVHVLKANKIMCVGSDKDQLSQFISTIRLSKKKDPYKGKGIFFLNENVLQKEGKKNKK
jgi:ribosomal protein L6P/L9E